MTPSEAEAEDEEVVLVWLQAASCANCYPSLFSPYYYSWLAWCFMFQRNASSSCLSSPPLDPAAPPPPKVPRCTHPPTQSQNSCWTREQRIESATL